MKRLLIFAALAAAGCQKPAEPAPAVPQPVAGAVDAGPAAVDTTAGVVPVDADAGTLPALPAGDQQQQDEDEQGYDDEGADQ